VNKRCDSGETSILSRLSAAPYTATFIGGRRKLPCFKWAGIGLLKKEADKMSNIARMWTHGYAWQADSFRPGYGYAYGEGAIYYAPPNSSVWFLFSVPSPAVLMGKQTLLTRVYVLYDTFPWATVSTVNVYDGGYVVQQYEQLSGTGEHAWELQDDNTFVLDKPHEMWYGVGIAIEVKFGTAAEAGKRPGIRYTSVGAEFEVP
jgi:hypothetical protein